jgi:hypothetical protein
MSRVDHAPPTLLTTWSSLQTPVETELQNSLDITLRGCPSVFSLSHSQLLVVWECIRSSWASPSIHFNPLAVFSRWPCRERFPKTPRTLLSTVGHLPRADRTSFGTKRHTHHDPTRIEITRPVTQRFRHTEHPKPRIAHKGRTSSTTTQFRPVTLVRGLVVADPSLANGWLWSF